MTGNGKRVLGAIMFTDVVGYVSLTERDEAAAIRVRDRHIGIVEPLVKRFHGELKQLHERHGREYSYGRFVDDMAARRGGSS